METLTVVHVAENNSKSAMLVAHVPKKLNGRTVYNKLTAWMESDKDWRKGEKITAPKGESFAPMNGVWILS